MCSHERATTAGVRANKSDHLSAISRAFTFFGAQMLYAAVSRRETSRHEKIIGFSVQFYRSIYRIRNSSSSFAIFSEFISAIKAFESSHYTPLSTDYYACWFTNKKWYFVLFFSIYSGLGQDWSILTILSTRRLTNFENTFFPLNMSIDLDSHT